MTEQAKGPEEERQNGRSPLLFLAGAVLLGLAAALLIFGRGLFQAEPSILQSIPAESGETTVAQPAGDDDNLLAVGDIAYNFHLPDLEGNTVSLEGLRGQPVVVNFWATWCPPCRLEMPALQAAQQQYRADGLVVLAVNDQESAADVAAFVAELDLDLTTLLDTDGVIANLYKVFNFPTTYFVDADGEITAVHRGLLTREQIDSYLDVTIP